MEEASTNEQVSEEKLTENVSTEQSVAEFLPDKQESHLNQGFLLHASSIVFQQPSTRQNVKIVHFPDYISRCLTTQQGSILRQRLEIHS